MVDTSPVGATALHAPAQDLLRLAPLARLSSDYPVLVVPAASPIRTAADLSQRSKSASKPVSIGVGALGSVDHIAPD